jgi:hypothetical protein
VSATTELSRLEAVIDAAGVSKQIEMLLPIGVRPRQLSVRTLLTGMLLAAVEGRPAHLRRVHQALLGLAADERHRLGVVTQWRTGPHLLTYRQVERTFALVINALSKDTPDGTPSQTLSEVLDRLLEASVQTLGEPASSSYAVDWTDHETWSRPPHKPGDKRHDPDPVPDNDPEQPTPHHDDGDDGDDDDDDDDDDELCADPEAAWGHRRGNHPGQKDEAFYGYYLQAATTVRDEHGPEVPELVRRMLLTACDHDPPPTFVPVCVLRLSSFPKSAVLLRDLVACATML